MLINRAKILRVLGQDPDRWAARYELIPVVDQPCFKCGQLQTTSIPFAVGRCRGLIAPVCECGHPYPPYCAVGVLD